MPNIPVTPLISSVTDHTAVITRGVDGNGPGVYYSFQFTYNVGLSTQVQYLKSDGTFDIIPVWMNITSITANSLIPNTLFSVRLSAANDATGTGDTGYG